MYFFDWTFILLIPALILAIYAQATVKGAFAKYSQVRASSGMTGAQLAADLLRRSGLAAEVSGKSGEAARRMVERLSAVRIELGSGQLTDHYDPRDKVLRLSPPVHQGSSLAALGVAAHETGHALQEAGGYPALVLRTTMVPLAQVGTSLAFPLFIGGLIFAFRPLMDLGILLYVGAVIFAGITLPVEFNASRRALALLESGGYLSPSEMKGAKSVLNAAALTYVAAALMAVLTLLRLLILRGARN